MSYRRALLRRWSRRDRLAVLIVALTAGFLVGTTLLVLAASDQTATIAADFETPGVVERYGTVAAAREAAPSGAVVLPVAQARLAEGRRVTVVGRTSRGWTGNGTTVPLFDAGEGSTSGRLEESRNVTFEGRRGSVTLDVRPRGRTALSPAWYVLPPEAVDRLGVTGALVVRPAPRSVPVSGVPLVSALVFFVLGSREVLQALSVTALGGGLLVGVTVYSVTRMTVQDRLRTIRVARATGARPRDVLLVFGLRGTLLAGVGVALGYAVGVILPNAAVSLAVFAGLPTSLSLDLTGRAAWLVGATALLTLVVGGIAGALAAYPVSRRPPGRLRNGDSPAGQHRLLAPRLLDLRTLVPTAATLTAFVLFAILVAGMAGAIAPLTSTDGATVTEPGASHPIASDVPVAYASALRARGIAASPEILAFAVTDGQPFVVRGVNATAFARVTDAEIGRGRYPHERSEALVGVDLARTLGVGIGDEILVGGSTIPAVTEVRIVGTMRAPGVFDDQLLVSLATARHLTGKAPGRVHFVRTTGLPAVPRGRGNRSAGAIGVVEVSAPDRVVANGTLTASVRLRNAGFTERTRTVTIGFDGRERTRRVTIGPGSARMVTVRFPTGPPGRYTLRAGEVTREVEVVPPGAIEIRGLPAEAPPGSEPLVRVRTLAGEPVANATVSIGNLTKRTGAAGTVRLPFRATGERVVTATAGEETASATVSVVPGAERRLLVETTVEPTAPGVLTRPVVRVRLRNPWNRTFTPAIAIDAPGDDVTRNPTIPPGAEETVTRRLPRRPPGTYRVEIEIDGREVAVTTYRVTGDDRIAVAIAEGASPGQSGIGRAARTAFGNLELVFGVILGLAGLMTVGGTTASFARAVHGRRRTIGIYRATGAPPHRILGTVLGDALRIGALATAGALLVGTTTLWGFEAAGLLSPFGIRISAVPSLQVGLGIALGALAISVLGAGLATAGLLLDTPGSLLADERGFEGTDGFSGGDAGADLRE